MYDINDLDDGQYSYEDGIKIRYNLKKVVNEFLDSGRQSCEFSDYGDHYKNARSCCASFNRSIARRADTPAKAIIRNGTVYLIRTNQEGG